MLTASADETVARSSSERVRALETWFVRAWCRWSVVAGVIVWGCAAWGLLGLLYLQPLNRGDAFWRALTWKPAMVCGLAVSLAPWIWRWSLSVHLSPRPLPTRLPIAACFAVAWVGLASLALAHPRGNWFFVEWAKVRTPNPSFARNTLMWSARDFEHAGDPAAPRRVTIVGSSQIYAATDLACLSETAARVRFQKQCLAGFGPMQYPWLLDRILESRPDLVVCWLSEFDFYREEHWPVNRLRWAASLKGLERLVTATDHPFIDATARRRTVAAGSNWGGTYADLWAQRGAAADLAFAAINPVWRHRDHVRQTVFGYWWDRSRPPAARTPAGALAESADLDVARENLRRNLGPKPMVETNFRSFEQFLRALRERRIEVVVVEGATHPAAIAVGDPAWRRETRRRLEAMCSVTGCFYLGAETRPEFTVADFADPYHLNAAAAARFSRFLAAWIHDFWGTRAPAGRG